jgi:LysM repeat protein
MKDEIEIERNETQSQTNQAKAPKNWMDARNLILIAAGILIMVLVFLFSGISGKDKSAEVLVQMEKNLAEMDKKIATIEKKQEDIRVPVKDLAEKVAQLEKRQDPKTKPDVAASRQAAAPVKRFHKVKKGETLSGIAKKYRLSLAELRKMNKLTSKTVLVPGQALIIGQEGKN